MNKTALTTIAPEIFRKRVIIEGYYRREVDAATLAAYFARITGDLGLRTYADPIIHQTGGKGKAVNAGFDGFVPLIDSGIYISVWSGSKFLSTIIYTCAEFDEERAVETVRDFFQLTEHEAAVF